MDDDGACKICGGEIPHGHAPACDYYQLEKKLEALKQLHVMQLAAISTASIQNTESTIKERITKGNPYWSVAYMDVCVAVDREMRERKRLTMRILGLMFSAGIPTFQMLCTNYDNHKHENHINIAYRYWNVEPSKYQAILLVWENSMNIYTPSDFQRTFQR